MSDYISREALLSATDGYDWQAGLKTVLKRIPAADVRPVRRGKWIESKSMMEVVYCSECGFRTVYGVMPDGLGRNFSYCPNCGARMEES